MKRSPTTMRTNLHRSDVEACVKPKTVLNDEGVSRTLSPIFRSRMGISSPLSNSTVASAGKHTLPFDELGETVELPSLEAAKDVVVDGVGFPDTVGVVLGIVEDPFVGVGFPDSVGLVLDAVEDPVGAGVGVVEPNGDGDGGNVEIGSAWPGAPFNVQGVAVSFMTVNMQRENEAQLATSSITAM
mmetsp:Transcript_7923/g.15915  ORF Transcript_7923/g.15915 Transcript_7923/m.15915 type:complete len:185 (-) Transcript_7923:939-1493(-)